MRDQLAQTLLGSLALIAANQLADVLGPVAVLAVAGHHGEATQCPLFPPCFSSSRMSLITMPRSAALHMS